MTTEYTGEYACVGATLFGGRCRTMVTLDSLACGDHAGEEIERAPAPTRLLVKFFTTKEWADRNMPNTPVVVKSQKRVQEIDEAHRQMSERLGVNHFAYRAKGDTGCAVFGQGGLPMASLEYLENELEDNGYFLHDLHVEVREDRPEPATIVFEYKRESTREILPDPTTRKRLFGSTWTKVDVWANPPKEDGAVVHTVNARIFCRETPLIHLTYTAGLWGAV